MASSLNKRILIMSVLLMPFAAAGSVTLNELFTDHMVLQRDMPLPVWGTAAPGEPITITLGSTTVQTAAGADGRWQVRLPAQPAGGPLTLAISGENRIVVQDMLVGEVWLCSGQSNMQMDVRQCLNAAQEVAGAHHPRIRQIEIPRKPADQPQAAFGGGRWEVCSPATVGEFTGVGYFFARELEAKLGVPIGLINAAWGGTPVEAWTPAELIAQQPEAQPIYARWQRLIKEYLAKPEAERNKPPSTQPVKFPDDPRLHQNRPCVLFNRMIRPAIPFAIRGAIWYQGETNVPRATQYRTLFPLLIRGWRSAWSQGDLPFLFVQLSNYEAGQRELGASALAELRESQTLVLSLPATAMTVAADLGDGKDCHPLNKQEVARRLSLAARALAYGETIAYSGPLYDTMAVEGVAIRIRFKHAEGLTARDHLPLKGFLMAGEDRRFVEAQATVERDTVRVRSDQVARPVAVRYAWADAPDGNLVNGAGLPASPFRTDAWPGITASEK